jgi:hypothetical protein
MILLGLQAVKSSTEEFLVVAFSELYSREEKAHLTSR